MHPYMPYVCMLLTTNKALASYVCRLGKFRVNCHNVARGCNFPRTLYTLGSLVSEINKIPQRSLACNNMLLNNSLIN